MDDLARIANAAIDRQRFAYAGMAVLVVAAASFSNTERRLFDGGVSPAAFSAIVAPTGGGPADALAALPLLRSFVFGAEAEPGSTAGLVPAIAPPAVGRALAPGPTELASAFPTAAPEVATQTPRNSGGLPGTLGSSPATGFVTPSAAGQPTTTLPLTSPGSAGAAPGTGTTTDPGTGTATNPGTGTTTNPGTGTTTNPGTGTTTNPGTGTTTNPGTGTTTNPGTGTTTNPGTGTTTNPGTGTTTNPGTGTTTNPGTGTTTNPGTGTTTNPGTGTTTNPGTGTTTNPGTGTTTNPGTGTTTNPGTGTTTNPGTGTGTPVPAVPEPATWGMMLLGFLAIGVAARGRRRGLRRLAA